MDLHIRVKDAEFPVMKVATSVICTSRVPPLFPSFSNLHVVSDFQGNLRAVVPLLITISATSKKEVTGAWMPSGATAITKDGTSWKGPYYGHLS